MPNVKISLIDSKTTEKRLPYPVSKTIKSTVSRYRIEDVNPPYIKEEISISNKDTNIDIITRVIKAINNIEEKTVKYNEIYAKLNNEEIRKILAEELNKILNDK